MGSGNSKKKKHSAPHDSSRRGKTSASDNNFAPSSSPRGVAVILNVYNLQRRAAPNTRSVIECLGLGLYHSGVEVFGVEWSFAGDPNCAPHICGIFPCRPKTALPSTSLRDSIVLGHLPPGTRESRVFDVLEKLTPQWGASSYHLLHRNCNHFAQAFCDAIAQEFSEIKLKKFPPHINRAARVAGALVPESLYRHVVAGGLAAQTAPGRSAAEGAAGGGGGQRGAGAECSVPPPIQFSREVLESMSVRELKTLMWVSGIKWDECVEKKDLVWAIETHRQKLDQKGTRNVV